MARGSVDPMVEALSKVDLFSDLNRKELKVIAGLTKEFRFSQGTAIVTEGEDSARFYLIVEGTVAVKVKNRTRTTLGPGDYFGELAVIDRGPRSATVIALEPVRTLSLASFSLRPVLRQYPEVTLKMLVKVAERLRRIDSQLTS
jgi:CRP/FNR family transcriptional regulator, cyclic AMP receptor protein